MRLRSQTIVPRVRMRLADGPARVSRRGITLAPSGGTRVVLERQSRMWSASSQRAENSR